MSEGYEILLGVTMLVIQILAAMLIVGMGQSVLAQSEVGESQMSAPVETPARGFKILPTVGLTSNRLVAPGDDIDYDLGYNLGALFDVGTGATVLETGLLFSQLNSKNESDGGTVKLNAEYLAIPIQGKTFFSGTQSGFFVRYGLLTNILLSADVKFESEDVRVTRDFTDNFNAIDPMANLALGFISQGVTGFYGDFSFSRSLVSISTDRDDTVFNESLMLNMGLAL